MAVLHARLPEMHCNILILIGSPCVMDHSLRLGGEAHCEFGLISEVIANQSIFSIWTDAAPVGKAKQFVQTEPVLRVNLIQALGRA